MRKGFSLIEILFVVIIVAVLSAIAVTQYQTAVDKSRFAALIPTTKALANAQEVYHLNNGTYTNDMARLDVNMKGATGDEAVLSSGAIVEIGLDDEYRYVKATRENLDNNYIMYQAHSQNYPGEIHCEALEGSSRAQKLCENMGGREISGNLTEGYTTYILRGTGAGIPASFAHEMGEGNYQTCESYPCSKVCARNLPNGYECQGTYQEDHSYSEQVCKNGLCVTTSYDPNGKVLSKSLCQQDEESGVCKEVLKKLYDNNGNIIENDTACMYRIEDGTCAAWSSQIKKEYDENGNLIHAEMLQTAVAYDELGRIVGLGAGTFEIDENGHLIANQSGSSQWGSSFVTFEYDDQGRVISATRQSGTGGGVGGGSITTYEYGDNGKLEYMTNTWQAGSAYKYEYDDENHLIKKTTLCESSSGRYDCSTTRYVYDGDKLIEEQYKSGNGNWQTQKTYHYDEDGHLESMDTSYVHTTYDEKGNVKTETNLYNNSVVTYEYDEKGNLLSRNFADKDGNTISNVTYEYDANGHLISYSQTGCGGDGLPIQYQYTEGSPVSYTQTNTSVVSVSYDYDAEGHLIGKTQTSESNNGIYFNTGNTITTTYDTEGNKISEDSYYTNYGSTTHTLTNYENGNIVSIQTINPDGSVGMDYSYTYNDDGKLTGSQYTNINAGCSGSYSWSYNTDGTLAQATNGSSTYTYTYENGVLTSVNNTNAQGNSIGHVTYENGKPVSVVDSSGQTTTYTYNEDGTLASKVTKDRYGTLSSSYTYGYDEEGHLTSSSSKTKRWWGSGGYDQSTYTYTYEGDQIVSSTDNYGSTTHYTYTSEGQLESSTVTNSSGAVQGTPTTYTYDENGYLVSSTGGRYCYSNCTTYSLEGNPPSIYMPNQPTTDVNWGVIPPGPVGCAMGSGNMWYE